MLFDYAYERYNENRDIYFLVPQWIQNLYETDFWEEGCGHYHFWQCSGIFYVAKLGLIVAPILLMIEYFKIGVKLKYRLKEVILTLFAFICLLNVGIQYLGAEFHWDGLYISNFKTMTLTKMESPDKKYVVYLENNRYDFFLVGEGNDYTGYLECDGGFYKALYIPIGSGINYRSDCHAEWNEDGLFVEGYGLDDFERTGKKEIEQILFTYEELAEWQKEPLWKWIPLTEE